MNDLKIKQAGCCSLCDAQIMEIERRVVEGPKQGEVAQFGSILPGAKRTTFVLLNGSITSLSTCVKCTFTPQNIPIAWTRMLLAAKAECDPEWRSQHRSRKLTHTQRAAACANLARLLGSPPLGILCTQTYAEILNG
jgi:hypothetical protein